MANVYYGDDGFSSITGNWNTVANWFSSLGGYGCCCSTYGGTPLGRVPNASTDNVIFTEGVYGSEFTQITTGPTGGYSGNINAGAFFKIGDGSYTGNITFATQTGASVSVGYQQAGITGGTFSGNITLGNGFEITGGTFNSSTILIPNGVTNISGGTFTTCTLQIGNTIAGSLLISGGTFGNSRFTLPKAGSYSYSMSNVWGISGATMVSGGSWSPTVNLTYNVKTGALVSSGLPFNPGFGNNSSSTFSPTYTITNTPDILGTGLL